MTKDKKTRAVHNFAKAFAGFVDEISEGEAEQLELLEEAERVLSFAVDASREGRL